MSNNDFFSIGKQKEPSVDIDLEEEKNWKDIKPTQQLDALNKNLFKKRKYEELQQKQSKFAENPKLQPSTTGRTLPFQQKKPQVKRFKSNKDESEIQVR